MSLQSEIDEVEYELRGQLAFIIGEQANGVRGDAIIELIEKRTQLASIEARIDELEQMSEDDEGRLSIHELIYEVETDGYLVGAPISRDDRIAALKRTSPIDKEEK